MNTKIGFHLKILCSNYFYEVIKKGLTIEKALIAKWIVKIFKEIKDYLNSSNGKSWYWNKNKNFINDGMVDSKMAQTTQPTLRI